MQNKQKWVAAPTATLIQKTIKQQRVYPKYASQARSKLFIGEFLLLLEGPIPYQFRDYCWSCLESCLTDYYDTLQSAQGEYHV